MNIPKNQSITKADIAPYSPYIGQWWHDTYHNITYVWVGQWMQTSAASNSTSKEDTFDHIEAYERVKRIL